MSTVKSKNQVSAELGKWNLKNVAIWRQLFNLFRCHLFESVHILFPLLDLVAFYLLMTWNVHQWDQFVEVLYICFQFNDLLLKLLNLLLLISGWKHRFECWFSRLKLLDLLFWLFSPLLDFLLSVLSFLSCLNCFYQSSHFPKLVRNHLDVIL